MIDAYAASSPVKVRWSAPSSSSAVVDPYCCTYDYRVSGCVSVASVDGLVYLSTVYVALAG